jgi:phage terminase small subunit
MHVTASGVTASLHQVSLRQVSPMREEDLAMVRRYILMASDLGLYPGSETAQR